MKFIFKYLQVLILPIILATTFSVFQSCSNDDEIVDANPVIYSVNDIVNNQPVTMGLKNNMYIIHGTNLSNTIKVYFNGALADLNTTLVTFNTVIVAVPEEVPFDVAVHELKLVTTTGVATYNFQIQQPAPEVADFYPVAGDAGTEVTITGNVLMNPTSVKFGTTEAQIVNASESEIKVIVPSGITLPAEISVTTSGGTSDTLPAKFGFTSVIYDDALLPSGWWQGTWNGEPYSLQDTSNVRRGQYSIKTELVAWGGFALGAGTPVNTTGSTAIKFSIYSEDGGAIQIVLNGNFDGGKVLNLNKEEWTNVTLPLSDFGNPNSITGFVIQEYNGTGNTYYIDDLGLL